MATTTVPVRHAALIGASRSAARLLLFAALLGLGLLSGAHSTSAAAGSVTYPAGWNLVSAPVGATFKQAQGSIYTFQIGDARYQVQSTSVGASGSWGYWAYFPTATTVTLGGISQDAGSVVAPAGGWIMIGSPSAIHQVVVSGADTVLTYDPVSAQYSATTILQPGQGAWAIRSTQGTIRMAYDPINAP